MCRPRLELAQYIHFYLRTASPCKACCVSLLANEAVRLRTRNFEPHFSRGAAICHHALHQNWHSATQEMRNMTCRLFDESLSLDWLQRISKPYRWPSTEARLLSGRMHLRIAAFSKTPSRSSAILMSSAGLSLLWLCQKLGMWVEIICMALRDSFWDALTDQKGRLIKLVSNP